MSVLVTALAATMADVWRTYLDERHPEKDALRNLLNDFARQQFPGKVKKNRLTVFRATGGGRVLYNGTRRLLVDLTFEAARWRALWRVKIMGQYLTVYLRPADTRNQRSTVALRVSDASRHCEGVAGLVWENGSYLVENLPRITPEQVRGVSSFGGLTVSDNVRLYAERTNLGSAEGLAVMKSMEHFARHFIGYTIRKKDGNPWGVFLLDSEEEVCPFGSTLPGGKLGSAMADRAQIFGSLLTT